MLEKDVVCGEIRHRGCWRRMLEVGRGSRGKSKKG